MYYKFYEYILSELNTFWVRAPKYNRYYFVFSKLDENLNFKMEITFFFFGILFLITIFGGAVRVCNKNRYACTYYNLLQKNDTLSIKIQN